MDPHQHQHQQQQQQQNRRRAVEAGGGSGQAHPPPQPCPRCNSNNTKFCYYNNYSLSQPRYFCKGCRRYWTQGGTLRNVPVGGGCRKSKRPKLEGNSAGGSTSHSQPSLGLPPPSLPQPSQLPHHHQQQLISLMAANNNNNNTNNSISLGNGNSNNNNNSNSSAYFGETSGLFLSSLGVNRPLSFGPNLGLLHGFGLPSFEHQQQPVQPQQQHNQEGSLPSMYSTREVGSSSTTPIHEWNLRMGPGPGLGPGQGLGPVSVQANANDHNHNHNQDRTDNNNRSNEPWSNLLGPSGLDDP